MRQILSLAIVGILAAGTAQAQFGSIVKRVKKATETFTPWSVAQEDAIGQAAGAKMFSALGYYDNPDMTKYVNLVGNTVAAEGARSDVQYHFAILNSEIVNAFAMPGGYIFITRGALANIQNESELAGVLAHEVAHVDSRHLEKEVRAKKTTSWAVEEGTAKIPAGSELNALTNDLITAAVTQRYGQDKESEADRKGVQFAAKAGYDPSGLISFLQRMSGVSASANPATKRALGMLDGKTHPPFAQRIADLQPIVAQQKQGGQTLADRYAKNVDFTKPVTSSVPSAGNVQCTLTQAKDRIIAERAALSSTSTTSTSTANSPCSLDDAKAKIAEARQVLQELDQGQSAPGSSSPAASKPTPKAAAAKKPH